MLKKSFYFLMATVALIWAISIPFLLNFFPRPEEAGSFGDMFGAINALFSGLAFAGVIYALILQDNETRQNTEQFQKSIRATEISARLTAYSTLLQECDSALHRYERWEATSPESDYKKVKETVRSKMKEYRSEVEKLARELNT